MSYLYILNPANGFCHQFSVGDFETEDELNEFIESNGFRLKDIDWLYSDHDVQSEWDGEVME